MLGTGEIKEATKENFEKSILYNWLNNVHSEVYKLRKSEDLENGEAYQKLSVFVQIVFRILQGLGVGPGSATERWPSRKIGRK